MIEESARALRLNLLRAMRGLIVALLWTGMGVARAAPIPDGGDSRAEPVELPKLYVRDRKPQPLKIPEIVPAGITTSEPPLDLAYPGSAYTAGVSKGYATVGVMLDANGRATDFLLIAYSQPYFGDALLRKARKLTYAPLRAKGTAVPSRYLVGYTFYPDAPVIMNASTALRHRIEEISGRPYFAYSPHLQSELDTPLEVIESAVPLFPGGFAREPGKVVEVAVSFYVDETGRLRLPNVDATASPLLVPNAIEALRQWRFKPPTIRGKPVLAYARTLVRFEQDIP